MNNPYNILKSLGLPDDTLSHIFSFNRPEHPIVDELWCNFQRCDKCNYPVRAYAGQISLRYFTIQQHCLTCNIERHLVCGVCPVDDSCDCSDDSWYSWFSF
jgi:hypothetical protein